MTMQAFTPAYLQREHTAPAILSAREEGTSYNAMNDWTTTPATSRTAKPPTYRTLMDWTHPRPPRAMPPAEPEEEEEGEEEEEVKYGDLPRPRGPEDYYKRVYNDLAKQIAYRWPNPGEPRNREGRIGGTWRHIKEVLGHGGSRVVFVDGLVRVYDDQKFTQKLQAQLPYRPHIRPLYAPIKGETTPPARASLSALPVLPGVPAASMIRDPNVERKLKLQERFPIQRRGFYSFPQ